jgi:hypothetical protein
MLHLDAQPAESERDDSVYSTTPSRSAFCTLLCFTL